MNITGMLYGAPLLKHVDFPTSEVLGPEATEDEIQGLIDRHKLILIKPIFRGGVGKKGKAGLIGRASDLKTALKEKERLYFIEHQHGNARAKANGVTFESGIPAEHEVYFAITDSTHYRAPTMTLTHRGGVDIEEIDKREVAQVPFEALTGLKAFVVANALSDIGAPKEIISPLVQQLPKLWELVHHYGMTTLELNPIRMRPGREGRLTPIACDFKCGFDRDDPRWQRLDLPDHLFVADASEFEHEVNQLRTHQGQSDVFVINEKGTILAPTFGGGANCDGGAGRGRDHFVRFRRQPALRKNEGGGAHLLQALAQAGERPFHHRRQVEQHRHLRDVPGDGRCAAGVFQQQWPHPALCRCGTRRTQSRPRHGRTGRDLRLTQSALSLLRLRQRHLGSRQLRQRHR